jgi:SAM-dependent methyltransferase
MSRFGELTLRAYFRTLSKPASRTTRASSTSYHKWQYETSAPMLASFPKLDFNNKRVLELGCGLGGRSVWLARNGAKEVVGIDINAAEIEEATRIRDEIYPHTKNLQFYHSMEDDVLTSLGVFDIVLLLDSLEHVVSPLKVLRLARKYVKQGGSLYFNTLGWYHHNGSHLGIPFATLFFSDESLANFMRWKLSRVDYIPTIWDSDPPTARWEGVYNLRDRPGEYLNKITIREVKKLVRYAPFRRGSVVLLGFRNARLRWLNPLRHIPIVNEVFHSGVVGFLEA